MNGPMRLFFLGSTAMSGTGGGAAPGGFPNYVAVNGAELETSSSGIPNGTTLELSLWLTVTGSGDYGLAPFIWGASNDTYVQLGWQGSYYTPHFQVKDSAGTRIFLLYATTPIYIGTRYHLYFSYDCVANTYVAKIDGVDVSGSPGDGPTAASAILAASKNYIFHLNGGSNLPAEVTEFWLSVEGTIHGYSNFVDSGEPAVISALGSPAVYLGDAMVASDYNSGDNNGSAALSVRTAGFVDVS